MVVSRASIILLLTNFVLAMMMMMMMIVSSVSGEVGNNNPAEEETRNDVVKATFVNQLPSTILELYWEKHADNTRRLEATIQPRGWLLHTPVVEMII